MQQTETEMVEGDVVMWWQMSEISRGNQTIEEVCRDGVQLNVLYHSQTGMRAGCTQRAE